MGVLDIVPAGVVSGKDVYKVFDYARENKFAIPAFNVTVSISAKGQNEPGRKNGRFLEPLLLSGFSCRWGLSIPSL